MTDTDMKATLQNFLHQFCRAKFHGSGARPSLGNATSELTMFYGESETAPRTTLRLRAEMRNGAPVIALTEETRPAD
jgi:hypothetical protein